jgi:hypothetical protein
MRTPSTQQHDTYTYTQGYLLSAIGYGGGTMDCIFLSVFCIEHTSHVCYTQEPWLLCMTDAGARAIR